MRQLEHDPISGSSFFLSCFHLKECVDRSSFICNTNLQVLSFLQIISECSSYYVRLLWSSISKLSYPPLDVYNSFDKEQIEKFEKFVKSHRSLVFLKISDGSTIEAEI